MRWQVHGIARHCERTADVTIIVNADTDYDAQSQAWLFVPGLDIQEIEPSHGPIRIGDLLAEAEKRRHE